MINLVDEDTRPVKRLRQTVAALSERGEVVDLLSDSPGELFGLSVLPEPASVRGKLENRRTRPSGHLAVRTGLGTTNPGLPAPTAGLSRGQESTRKHSYYY